VGLESLQCRDRSKKGEHRLAGLHNVVFTTPRDDSIVLRIIVNVYTKKY
jgi:hypothetical protein